MTICEFCIARFFREPFWLSEEKIHHTDAEQWEVSVKQCTICSCLLETIRDTVIEHLAKKTTKLAAGYTARFAPVMDAGFLRIIKDNLPLYKVILQESAVRDCYVLIFCPIEDNVRKISFFTLNEEVKHFELPIRRFQVFATVHDNSEPPLLSDETSIDVQSHVQNKLTLDQIQKWISVCNTDEDHAHCRHSTSNTAAVKPFVPTRLVAVGQPGQSSVSLVETDHKEEYKTYATLSHCWGGFITVQTYGSTIERYKKSVPLDANFPRNFREAIELCRAIGIHYIWIDSLCIVQDNKNDWHVESATMQDVYGNSHINIAAASASDSTEGLFRHRQTKLLSPSVVPVEWQGRRRLCKVIREDFWSGEVLSEPLYRRSWVSQERMLSPRTLNFGSKQLFWQCLSMTACETMPNGIPRVIEDVGRDELQWRQLLKGNRLAQEVNLDNKIELQEVWMDVVNKYTNCFITKSIDKLPALAGLAKVMAENCGEEYVAGLWYNGDETVTQLAWRVKNGRNAGGKPSQRYGCTAEEYIAPSWAWPSVDGVIEIPRRVASNPFYRVRLKERPRLEYSTENSFMALKSGSVDVVGSVVEVDFVPTDEAEALHWVWAERVPGNFRSWCHLYPDEPLLFEQHIDGFNGSSIPARDSRAAVADMRRLTIPILFLYCLQELDRTYSGYGLAVRVEETPLLSETMNEHTRSKNDISGTFSRIGLVEFRKVELDIWKELNRRPYRWENGQKRNEAGSDTVLRLI